MKKSGFTLAEVLITLMILGVIAALTIPSLVQNTQKREQVVQLKKGLSMINQAITMNYALTQEDLAGAADRAAFITILKNRLAVVDSGEQYVRTQDGLTYYIGEKQNCSSTGDFSVTGNTPQNQCFDVVISTKAGATKGLGGETAIKTYDEANAKTPEEQESTPGAALTGFYQFYAGADRVVPSGVTSNLIYASDATKISASDS